MVAQLFVGKVFRKSQNPLPAPLEGTGTQPVAFSSIQGVVFSRFRFILEKDPKGAARTFLLGPRAWAGCDISRSGPATQILNLFFRPQELWAFQEITGLTLRFESSSVHRPIQDYIAQYDMAQRRTQH